MVSNRDGTIVSQNIDGILFDQARFEIPIGRVVHIGRFHFFTINEQFPMPNFQPLSLQGGYPFKEHDLPARKAHQNDIVSFWFSEDKGGPPAKIEASIMIGWLHAATLHPYGDTDMTKENVSADSNE
jgi:hypothetical protein